jgi:hypothetical protein
MYYTIAFYQNDCCNYELSMLPKKLKAYTELNEIPRIVLYLYSIRMIVAIMNFLC